MKVKNIISVTGIYDDDPMESGLIGANVEIMNAPGYPPLTAENLTGIATSLIETAIELTKAEATETTEIHSQGTGAAQ